MNSLLTRHTRTFILRIWAEYLEQTPPTWRGEIEDVTTKEVTRFHSQEELAACLQRCLENHRESQR
ncbi:MAG: hypothetical protein ACP5JG_13855 [Anaerolineae bacterium]